MDMDYGHGIWTCYMDMDCGHDLWTCYKDMNMDKHVNIGTKINRCIAYDKVIAANCLY